MIYTNNGMNCDMIRDIIIGYEKINLFNFKYWNLNGRIHNAPLLASFYDIGNQYHRDIYQIMIDPHNFPDATKDQIMLFGNKFMGKYHINLPITHIPENRIYFYPIKIYSAYMYTEFISKIEINSKVIDDIKNKKCYLIFIYYNEGDLRYCYTKFCKLVADLNLPKEQILCFHGDLDKSFFKDAPFTYCPTMILNWWMKGYRNRNSIVKYKPNKLFVSYNRTLRQHKLLLLASLIKHNLLDSGIYSCGSIDHLKYLYDIFPDQFDNHVIDQLKKIELTSSDNEINNREINNITWAFTERDLENSFLSLVTETLTEGIFITEKTFKPIAAGHPFIILSGAGHLSELKKLGYKTFEDFWDESYDLEFDVITKIKKIINTLKFLNSLSKEKLLDLRSSMISILEYNQSVFRDSLSDMQYLEETKIKEHLLKIVKERNV